MLLSDEISKLLSITIKVMKREKISTLKKVSVRPTDSVWHLICIDYYGKYEFNKAQRILNLWLNNSHYYADSIQKEFSKVKPH
jgi:hypothetical protein